MTFVSYAQNFEDVRLWRAFSDVEGGRYLDIGAQEPIRDSVSYAFYLRGWRGVHVEPTPAYAAALRAARPDELVIEAAASCAPGPIPLYEISETGLSTGIADLAKRHAQDGWAERAIAVPTVTLAGLFDLMGEAPIHWLKIDVEGMEADVLESWGDHPARPAALVIEATAPNTQIQTHGEWHDLVIGRDYREVLFDGLSRYFIHKSHAHRGEALALSPNVFDGFKVPEAHFVAGLIVTERDARLAAAHAQAAAEHQSLAEQAAAELAAAQAQAAAELAAVRDEAEAEVGLARAEAAYSAEAATQRMQVRLDDQAAASGAALADARSALDALRQHNAALSREAGQLEGELSAQTAAYEARLGDAEAVRSDLSARLASSEQALAIAHGVEAELRREIQDRISEDAQAFTDARVALARQEARVEQLTAEIGVQAQLLGQSEAKRDAATRQLDEVRQRLGAQVAALQSDAERLNDEAATLQNEFAALQGEAGRLRSHVAWRELQLAQAAELLVAVPDPLAGWPRRFASLLAWVAGRRLVEAQAREEARTAAVTAWQAALALPLQDASQETPLSLAGNEATALRGNAHWGFDMLESDEPITSVPRLLAPHDTDFIIAAYQAVLGRAPDPDGAAYYLARLRAGTHKLTILKQLRRSPEGRAFIPGVAGLDRAIKRHRRATLPLIGPIIRLMTGAEGNDATARQLRVIANDIGRLRMGQEILSNAVTGFHDELQNTPLPTTLAMQSGNQVPEARLELEVGQDANIKFHTRPSLNSTLAGIGTVENFDEFRPLLQASLAASREATALSQR